MGLLTRIDPVQALRTTNSREAYPVQVRSSMLFMCIHPPIVTCMVGELQGSTCGSHETGYSGCSKHFGALFRIQGACVRVLHSLAAHSNSTTVCPIVCTGDELLVVAVHLLAGSSSPQRCLQREAQATVIRNFVTGLVTEPNKRFIIVGDMNDYDDSLKDAAADVPISKYDWPSLACDIWSSPL